MATDADPKRGNPRQPRIILMTRTPCAVDKVFQQ
jgi:hypothetical protein